MNRHKKLRNFLSEKLLPGHEFSTIEHAQEETTKWLWTYNNERPNMAIGGITPAMKLANATNLLLSTS
jgi:putative transposase